MIDYESFHVKIWVVANTVNNYLPNKSDHTSHSGDQGER